MLPSQQELLRASLPLFREQGETIAGIFYEEVFLSHPHLSDRFSIENQVNGSQAERFMRAVLAYVESLGQVDVSHPWLANATRTHIERNVRPSHYDIFRVHFLQAIKTVLRNDASQELIDAWAAAYDELAAMMIAAQSSPHSA